MSKHVLIKDLWVLARPKVKLFGAYPAGFLERARALLGVRYDVTVLHVCGGAVKAYPYRGFGPNDLTVDLVPSYTVERTRHTTPEEREEAGKGWITETVTVETDYVLDVRNGLPRCPGTYLGWPAVLVDPPYSPEEAEEYGPGPSAFPEPGKLLKACLHGVGRYGRVGFLHRQPVRPPPSPPTRLVAMVGVMMGFGNDTRAFCVYERM